jgi:hypothetical protein
MVFFEGPDDPGDQSGGAGDKKSAWGPALIGSAVTLVIILAIVVALAFF